MILIKQRRIYEIIILFLLFGSILYAQPVPALFNFDGSVETYQLLPRLLSETGFDPDDEEHFVFYDVNVPEWQSFLQMKRYVFVPQGQSIITGDSVNYQFPVGTAFFRLVYLDTISNEPSTRINIECQIKIMHQDSSFKRISYLYREDQSDAELVTQEDFVQRTYRLSLPEGLYPYVDKNGNFVSRLDIRLFRSAYDCDGCHYPNAASGFFTQQLNFNDQLQNLQSKGVIASVPQFINKEPSEFVFRWYGVTDSSGTPEQRVRSYLAAQCANCHHYNPQQPITGMLSYFEYFQNEPVEQTDLWKFITPGKPESTSFCHYPVSTQIPDAEWENLLWNWVSSLDNNSQNDSAYPGTVNLKPVIRHETDVRAFIQNGILRLNTKPGTHTQILFFSLKGRRIYLRKLSDNIYSVSENLSSGLYILKNYDKSILVRSF
jgi:hypothetical protein